MSIELASIALLHGLSYGLLLFMLASGLTLIFSMMGVLNFAHASFYMLGAYCGHHVSAWLGFWAALIIAPIAVGCVGACIERYGLRRVHAWGHVPELLFTFGLSTIIFELVQLIWGRAPLTYPLPQPLQGALVTVFETQFPASRAFVMLVACVMMLALWLMLVRTRVGLLIQAALTHPQALDALGHDVRRVHTCVFGAGSALAALAGVIGGAVFVTEPGMAAGIGAILFVVVVVGGMGSLAGTFIASLMIGMIESVAKLIDVSMLDALAALAIRLPADTATPLLRLTVSQVAPVLPYLLLVVVLVTRPRGLMGNRGD